MSAPKVRPALAADIETVCRLLHEQMNRRLPPERWRRITTYPWLTEKPDFGRVVDDGGRNVFTLSTLIGNHGMDVTSATNGRDAIDILQRGDDLSVVLMDIMMPGMDGYETMREIRRQTRFRKLPILALTAKAMKGDREKCLDAGASDYIAKPVNSEQLLSLLRVWLHR